MSRRLKMLIAAAVLLLLANIIKMAVFPHAGKKTASGVYNKSKLSMNFQQPAGKVQARVIRDLFDGDNGAYAPKTVEVKPVNTPAPAPTQEEKWPDFRISGVAVNDGRKCAFFSGQAFSGAVYEGEAITDKYTLTAISEDNAEIINNATGVKRNYPLEGR